MLKSYTDRVLEIFSKRWGELCQSADAEKDWKEIEQYAEFAIPQQLSSSGAEITSQGFPSWTLGEDGRLGVDIKGSLVGNLFVQEIILYSQLLEDPPPIPQPIPDDPHGKKDSKLFVAWYKRYPQLGQVEKASLADRSARQVRRWLNWEGTQDK